MQESKSQSDQAQPQSPEFPHTPWHVGKTDYGSLAVLAARYGERLPDGFTFAPIPIARVPDGHGRSEEEAVRIARLLAAAPDLLHAVETLFPPEDWERWERIKLSPRLSVELRCKAEELLALRDAIRKARGQEGSRHAAQ